MNYYPAFAELLNQYLAQADRSGAWLAQRLGVNPTTVTRWRNGDTRPHSPEMVIRLADVLGLHEPTARQQFLYNAGYGYLAHAETAAPNDQPPAQPSALNNAQDLPALQPFVGRSLDYWQKFPLDYRAREMQTLAQWIAAGVSGAVVGLPGVGKSNLLSFLYQRPDALRHYLPAAIDAIVLVPVALNSLLETTLGALYRLFVRSFYERREYFTLPLQAKITEAYRAVSIQPDTFLAQGVLRDLLFAFEGSATRIVLVLDRFDVSYRLWTPEMRDTLRDLRDKTRDTLTYILGVGRNLAYLDEIALSHDLHRLLATHHCYVGPLSEADARNLIARRLALSAISPTATEITHMLALTGGYPTLLKMVCHWWLMTLNKPSVDQWLPSLRAEMTMQKRLADIWRALTQAEQQVLFSLQQGNTSGVNGAMAPAQQAATIFTTLLDKGLCFRAGANLQIFSLLFADYIAQMGAHREDRSGQEENT